MGQSINVEVRDTETQIKKKDTGFPIFILKKEKMKKVLMIVILMFIFVLVGCTEKSDKEPPLFEGVHDTIYKIGDNNVDYLNGISAFDENDGVLTNEIQVDISGVDLSTIGVYNISYSVKDKSGNLAYIDSQVFVHDINLYLSNIIILNENTSSTSNNQSIYELPIEYGRICLSNIEVNTQQSSVIQSFMIELIIDGIVESTVGFDASIYGVHIYLYDSEWNIIETAELTTPVDMRTSFSFEFSYAIEFTILLQGEYTIGISFYSHM